MFQPYKKQKGLGNKKYSTPCKYFAQGRCANKNCPYLHAREGDKTGNVGHARTHTHNQLDNNKSLDASNVMATMLKLFFEKQQSVIFDVEQRALNLSNLVQYEDLKSVAQSMNFNTRTFCEALANCVRDLIVPPPSILSLKNNNITSFYHLSKTLQEANLHTALRALSLADNSIKTLDVANELKSFSNLNEVDLRNNPVTTQDGYKQRMRKVLPFLLGLDGDAINAAPLFLPWPKFYNLSQTQRVHESDLVYDQVQLNLLTFVQNRLLAPLEGNDDNINNNNNNSSCNIGNNIFNSHFSAAANNINNSDNCSNLFSSWNNDADAAQNSGLSVSGVDKITDVYATNAVMTLSLSCNEASVSTPPRTASGGYTSTQRELVRELVGLRMRQNDSNHNIMLGIKSTQVAVGRSKVCAQLEHWLYPRTFKVIHYIHPSPNVVLLDNAGCGPNMVVGMKQPLSVVTLHGVMVWLYRISGQKTSSPTNSSSSNNNNNTPANDVVMVKRNFSRVLTIATVESGKWEIVNDMVTLYPFKGRLTDEAEAKKNNAASTLYSALYDDIHPYEIVYNPRDDPHRTARLARKYGVPESVVMTLNQYLQNDMELITILLDLKDVPLSVYEEMAQLVDLNPLLAIILCRMGNKYGVDPQAGVALVREYGTNWIRIEEVLSAQNNSTMPQVAPNNTINSVTPTINETVASEPITNKQI